MVTNRKSEICIGIAILLILIIAFVWWTNRDSKTRGLKNRDPFITDPPDQYNPWPTPFVRRYHAADVRPILWGNMPMNG